MKTRIQAYLEFDTFLGLINGIYANLFNVF